MDLDSAAITAGHRPAFGHENKRHLPDEIASAINVQVQRGELQPGERLPSEREICEQFGVSRAVVREAHSQLKSDRVIEERRGRGDYVLEREQRQSFRLLQVAVHEGYSPSCDLVLIVLVKVVSHRITAISRQPE